MLVLGVVPSRKVRGGADMFSRRPDISTNAKGADSLANSADLEKRQLMSGKVYWYTVASSRNLAPPLRCRDIGPREAIARVCVCMRTDAICGKTGP